jgi:hypothetical protein
MNNDPSSRKNEFSGMRHSSSIVCRSPDFEASIRTLAFRSSGLYVRLPGVDGGVAVGVGAPLMLCVRCRRSAANDFRLQCALSEKAFRGLLRDAAASRQPHRAGGVGDALGFAWPRHCACWSTGLKLLSILLYTNGNKLRIPSCSIERVCELHRDSFHMKFTSPWLRVYMGLLDLWFEP